MFKDMASSRIFAREILRVHLRKWRGGKAAASFLKRGQGWHKGEGPKPKGHWKATEHLIGKIIWKILYTNLDLKGGGTGAEKGGSPCPPLRSGFVHRLFHTTNFQKNVRLPSSGQHLAGFEKVRDVLMFGCWTLKGHARLIPWTNKKQKTVIQTHWYRYVFFS